MFAISERVSPCRARWSPRSVGRLTTIVPSSCSTVMSRDTRSSSSPRVPLTRTTSGSMNTSTPAGTGMGCFPIRLIAGSPHVGDDFAADGLALGLVAGHHAAGGRHDRRAHAAEDLGDLARVDIGAAAGRGHALQPRDHRRAVLGVLQAHAQSLADAGRLGAVVLDVALLLEDAGQLHLELGGRDDHRVVLGGQRVANAREEVGYWIVDHQLTNNYQLDFVMPGTKPSWACSRRHIRHRPNLRKYARERPQRLQ